jgi:hypothetical protein
MNGMQNDLPMATRDAMEAREGSLPEAPNVGSEESSSSQEIKDPEARYVLAIGKCVDDLVQDVFKTAQKTEALETKFRTLQTRCNSMLAMQAQIDALLNELKIRIRGKILEPKKVAKRR